MHYIKQTSEFKYFIKAQIIEMKLGTRIKSALLSYHSVKFYRLPKNLGEGNVFICVCLFTEGVFMWPLLMMHSISLYRPLPISDLKPPTSDIWWSSLKTCSNLFIWRPPSKEQHLVVAIEGRTFGESGRYASYWNVFLFWDYLHHEPITGRERLIRSHSSARFSFELSGNSN